MDASRDTTSLKEHVCSNNKKGRATRWLFYDPNFSWNDARLQYFKSWGYDGPIEYDEKGNITTLLSPQEIKEWQIRQSNNCAETTEPDKNNVATKVL